MALTGQQWLLCLGMLVTGAINTLSKKAQNQFSAPGVPDPKNNNTATDHLFNHPWYQTILMFAGEVLCIFGLLYSRYRDRKAQLESQHARLMVSPSNADAVSVLPVQQPKIFHWIFALPTFFDLLGTSLAGIGLLYVDASIWQMLRGSIIIFTGIFSKIFLKRKLKKLNWLGMLVTTVGLGLVGLSGVLKESSHADEKIVLGLILVLAGQLASAGQMVVEEVFMKGRGFDPLQVVGMEGTFGFLMMAVVVLPIMYYIPGDQIGNRYENSVDALYQTGNSPALLILSLLYLVSIAFYNYFGLSVTKSLTAVHRTLFDALRTVVVWLVSVIIFYGIDEKFGEPFEFKYSIFQVDGFMLLLMGTALYNEIMDVPCIPSLRRSEPETYPSLVESRSVSVEGNIQEELSEPLLKSQQHTYS